MTKAETAAPDSKAWKEAELCVTFDPEITDLWTPDLETEHPPRVRIIWPPEAPEEIQTTVLPRKKNASAPRGRALCSAALSVINGLLLLGAVGSAIYLITSLFSH